MGPRSFGIQITDLKMWPAPTKTGVPYNFCFIKFSPNRTFEAAEAHPTLFRAPLILGVGVWGQIPAMNLPPIVEYTHAKFYWDWSSGLDFYCRHIRQTHWLLYIRFGGGSFLWVKNHLANRHLTNTTLTITIKIRLFHKSLVTLCWQNVFQPKWFWPKDAEPKI